MKILLDWQNIITTKEQENNNLPYNKGKNFKRVNYLKFLYNQDTKY